MTIKLQIESEAFKAAVLGIQFVPSFVSVP